MPEPAFESAVRATDAYLADETRLFPFFVALDDGGEYARFVQRFSGLRGIQEIRLHGFCPEADAEPDIDALKDALARRGGRSFILLGVGDAVRLFAPHLVDDLRGTAGGGKLVVPCRGARGTLERLAARDGKFAERQVAFASRGAPRPVEIHAKDIPVEAVDGLKGLLAELENGGAEPLCARTDRPLRDVSQVRSVFDAWKRRHPALPFTEGLLADAQWLELLRDDRLENGAIDHWHTFLRLRQEPPPKDSYLAFALGRTENAAQWRDQLVFSLLEVKRDDPRFDRFAAERKELLGKLGGQGWTPAAGAEYAAKAGFIGGEDRWAYLTDLTMRERMAVVSSLSGLESVPSGIAETDPRLADYLRDFIFHGPEAETLTAYFRDYKRCKVLNRVEPEFLATVERLAMERPFNSLRTRGAELDLRRNAETGLYWLDALGCEYLGYIQARARELGLAFTTTIVRANLPTITCHNRDFYDSWPSAVKTMSKALDRIKHGEASVDYMNTKTPEHLPAELDAVEQSLNWIAETLAGRKVRRVLLVSDHGASRLAVIHEHENRWTMATKGEHSGRCCPKAEINEKPDCATEEETPDGKPFWVLANYDRFRGGRKASVEVHGGASIEEVVIPLIEFTLAGKQVSVRNETATVKLGNAETPVLRLFSPDHPKDVSVVVDGIRYPASESGQDGRYLVPLTGFKRAGHYHGLVLEGENEIASISFDAEGRAARIRNDDFF